MITRSVTFATSAFSQSCALLPDGCLHSMGKSTLRKSKYKSPRSSPVFTGGELFVIGVGDAQPFQLTPVASDDPQNPGSKFLWFDDWSALSNIYIEISEKIMGNTFHYDKEGNYFL